MTSENNHDIPASCDLPVPPAGDGERLDIFLARQFKERSRAYLQRIIRSGAVALNGRPCRPADLLKTNDQIAIIWPPEPRFELTPESMPLDVLFEDSDVLVLNKPPGLVVHPAKGNWTGTLVQGLLAHDEEDFSALADDAMRPGIVHRLDKDTSGVMVVAKNSLALERLRAAFHEHLVEKVYLALVHGEFDNVTGKIVAPIGRHPRDRIKMAVVPDKGKPAESTYRVLASAPNVSLVEVRILTGRTHQIRVHFSYIHHPVVGDPLYGGQIRGFPKGYQPQRQMLHAWKLSFPHPVTEIIRTYLAPPPDDFKETLKAVGMAAFFHHDSAHFGDHDPAG